MRLHHFSWCGLLLALPLLAAAQGANAPTALTGTLAKVRESGTIAIGHRVSSVPFSYLSARDEPIGYSIELCKRLVEAIGDEVGRTLAIKWVPVTSESRLAAVVGGQVDLECGSTTSNLERQKQVAFSPTIFIAGTRLLVTQGSPVRSFRDLAGRRVVVTAGTTNEKTMRELAARFRIDLTVVAAGDHAASFEQLRAGQVDAFATDDVLLYGMLAQRQAQADYAVVGDFLSYEPYALMFRKGDPQFARVIQGAFQALAEDGDIERAYTRWFLRKLATGVSLNLPMSPQLETLLQAMGARSE